MLSPSAGCGVEVKVKVEVEGGEVGVGVCVMGAEVAAAVVVLGTRHDVSLQSVPAQPFSHLHTLSRPPQWPCPLQLYGKLQFNVQFRPVRPASHKAHVSPLNPSLHSHRPLIHSPRSPPQFTEVSQSLLTISGGIGDGEGKG